MADTFEYHTSIDCGVFGELDCVIKFNYTKATRDVMYLPNGDPGYPGDPAEVNVLSIEWPCDDAYIKATWDNFDEDTQETLREECEAHALECLSANYPED